MFSAGIRGYSGARGMLGALRAREPKQPIVEELLNQPDAAAAFNHLRSMPFLAGIASGDKPVEIERDLRYGCVLFGKKLADFTGGAAQKFLKTYLLHYEVHNLKALFRRALAGKAEARTDDLYPVAPVYSSASRVGALSTPERVVALAEKTRLEGAVKTAYGEYQANTGDLFRFDLSLDRELMLMLWSAAERTGPVESWRLKQVILMPLLGTRALVWGLWLKHYHGMSAQEIMGVLLVPSGLIDAEVFIATIQAEDMRQAAEAVSFEPLKEFLAETGVPEDIVSWQRLLRRFVWGRVAKRDMGMIFDAATLMREILRWEHVVEDAITVASGKSLEMGREDIVPLLATQAA